MLLLKSAFWRRTAIVFAAEKPLRISASCTRRGKKSPVFKCANNSFKRTQLVCNRELLRPKAAEMKRNLKWNQKREFISAPHHPTPTPSSFTHSHTHTHPSTQTDRGDGSDQSGLTLRKCPWDVLTKRKHVHTGLRGGLGCDQAP